MDPVDNETTQIVNAAGQINDSAYENLVTKLDSGVQDLPRAEQDDLLKATANALRASRAAITLLGDMIRGKKTD